MATDEPLDTKAAALYLGKSISWLKQARCVGSPAAPPFVKVGRSVRYLRRDLDAFLAGRKFTSTISARASTGARAEPPLSAR